jgi:cytochrome c-type biogenesis protein
VIATLPSSLLAAIPLAVAAGLVSFVSPCVLPLVPGYVAFLGGAVGKLEPKRRRGRAVFGALSFVCGFAVVFVSEGALFGELGNHLQHDRAVSVVFGLITIILGMFFAGWLPNSWLQRERRSHRLPSATVLGALALGFLFGLGWIPCIGPTLAAIDGLAASTSGATAFRGSLLAFFYCLGLGLPFVMFAMAGEWATKTSKFLRRHQRFFAVVGGAMLILIGVLEVTGLWAHFVTWLQVHFPSSSTSI